MEKTTGKEGKGVKGTGFEGGTGSNNYSQLPRSSNAAFGIDANVAAGVSNMHNPDGDTMDPSKFGIGEDISTGTVNGELEGVIAPHVRGEFGVSAKSGNPPAMLNSDEYYGSGARKAGTAAAFGEPGRGGSMALAAKGLKGNASGGSPEMQKTGSDASNATLQSKKLAHQGIKGSGGAGNNAVS